MSDAGIISSGRRFSRWRRLGVVGVILLLGALVQYSIFLFRIITHRDIKGAVAAVGVFMLIGVVIGLILWRGWKQRDSFLAFLSGLVGSLLFSFVNLRFRTTCVVDAPAVPFPYLLYYTGSGQVGGFRLSFYPTLLVVRPDGSCYISVNLLLLGGAMIFITAWLWLGDVPGEVLDRFAKTSEES